MKKIFFILMTMIAFMSFVFIIDSCKKDDEQNNTLVTKLDTIKPVITLKGSSTMAIVFGSTWSDPGYTAADNKDGDLTTKVIINGTINNYLAGTVTLTYSVTDLAGNTGTAARYVTVDAAPFLTGDYSVIYNNNIDPPLPYTDYITLESYDKNKIYFHKFAFYTDGLVYVTLSGTTVTLPTQIVNCGPVGSRVDHTFSGSGNFTNGKGISITYRDVFDLNGIHYDFANCTETYTHL